MTVCKGDPGPFCVEQEQPNEVAAWSRAASSEHPDPTLIVYPAPLLRHKTSFLLFCSTGTRRRSSRRRTSGCCSTPSTATSSTSCAGAGNPV
jgi:hypothetical protein